MIRRGVEVGKIFLAVFPTSLIGVSHAASEYVVIKTRIKGWLEHRYGLDCVLVPQAKWWM